VPAADLRFGDVIRFTFGDAECIAMVIATKGPRITTEENIDALGDTDNILVLGLSAPTWTADFHRLGQTAAFAAERTDYKVLR